MGSSTSFLLIGGELIYIQLSEKKKNNVCQANNFTQANNKWDIIKKKKKEETNKQTTTRTTKHKNTNRHQETVNTNLVFLKNQVDRLAWASLA